MNNPILLDTGVLRLIMGKEETYKKEKKYEDLCTKLHPFIADPSQYTLVLPPLLGLEFMGFNLKKLARPKFPCFDKNLTPEERVCVAYRIAKSHYKNLSNITLTHFQHLLSEQKKYISTEIKIGRIFEVIQAHLLHSDFYNRSIIALSMDCLMAYRDWGCPPAGWNAGQGKIRQFNLQRQFLVAIEHQLLGEGLRLRKLGYPAQLARRMNTVSELLLDEYEVKLGNRWQPIKSLVTLGSQDNSGDAEYLDCALWGDDNNAVEIYTFDHHAEVYTRLVVLRYLYHEFLNLMSSINIPDIPRMIGGRVITLRGERNIETIELDLKDLPQLEGIFRWRLTEKKENY